MFTIVGKTELLEPEYELNVDHQFAGGWDETHDCLAEALSSALNLNELIELHEKLGVIVSGKIEAKRMFYNHVREIANKRLNELKSSGQWDEAINYDNGGGVLIGIGNKFKD